MEKKVVSLTNEYELKKGRIYTVLSESYGYYLIGENMYNSGLFQEIIEVEDQDKNAFDEAKEERKNEAKKNSRYFTSYTWSDAGLIAETWSWWINVNEDGQCSFEAESEAVSKEFIVEELRNLADFLKDLEDVE